MRRGQGIWDLILPRRCAACGLPGEILCRGCRAGLLPIAGPLCAHCGHPWAVSVAHCAECWRLPPSSRQALVWTGPITDLIGDLKDRGVRAAAGPCAEAIVDHTPALARPLVPVPPSLSGLRERGFDQALLIARLCAEAWEVDVVRALKRTGRGRQRGATRRQRRALTREAFRVRGTYSPREVVLIDDVVTTGSTLAAAASALSAAGWSVVATRSVARVSAVFRPG